MLENITSQMVALFIAIIVNILLGVYYNINLNNVEFNIKTLLTGVIKGIIIGVSFIGVAYCFDTTDLSQVGISPDLIMNSAIVLYITKSLYNLAQILGVPIQNSKNNTESQNKMYELKDVDKNDK